MSDSGRADADYAPYPLSVDEVALGLTQSRVSSAFGTAVARSRKTNRNRRATIFLHGAAGSWTTWTPLLAAADAGTLSIPNPVLVDLPGWGDATLSAEGETSMIEALAGLVRTSAEALGYTEWDLVGHSMGGFIALHMAAIWPECVLSVATVSASSWAILDASGHPVRHFWRLPGFVMLWRTMQAMSRVGRFGAGLASALARLHLLRAAVAPLFRYPRQIPASVIRALGTEIRPRAFSLAVGMGVDYDASAAWAKIECPVRAVKGDRDVFSRQVDFTRLGDILPASHRETIEACGHFAHIERPNEVLAALGYRAAPRGLRP
jgi:pimeloyl-ACP methyl ester carboxylesterase